MEAASRRSIATRQRRLGVQREPPTLEAARGRAKGTRPRACYDVVVVMSLPAESLSAVSLPIFDVDSAFAGLPAASRAQLAWARKPIADALDRLCSEPLDEALLDATADAIWPPFLRIGLEVFRVVAERGDEGAAEYERHLSAIEERLRDHLADDDATDTLSWILALLRSYGTWSLTFPRELLADLTDADLRRALQDPMLRPIARVYAALAGAGELARRGENRELARELVDVAFLAAAEFRQNLERAGLWTWSVEQTDSERRERQGLYASRLRAALDAQDVQTIASARLSKLR
jgi:hypothetical protein